MKTSPDDPGPNAGAARLRLAGVLCALLVAGCGPSSPGDRAARDNAAAPPLASWNDGPARSAILGFVARVSTPGSPDFVPVPERVAVFDNDGTLWAERPLYFQLQFALDRVKALAPRRPEWRSKEPFRALLSGDREAFLAGGERSLAAVMAASHAGITPEEFAAVVREWLHTATHPRTGQPYTSMVYAPMLELLDHLRASGFKTFIVSGGGVEFMRVFADSVYGIPPEQVVGSQGKLRYELRDGRPTLLKLPEVQFVDDGPGKPAGIQAFIGRRPIAAFGNSDGDLEMLQWTTAGPGPRFALLVHHTDAAREWAYDRESHIGRLDRALDEATASGWTVADMQRDWKRVFAFERP